MFICKECEKSFDDICSECKKIVPDINKELVSFRERLEKLEKESLNQKIEYDYEKIKAAWTHPESSAVSKNCIEYSVVKCEARSRPLVIDIILVLLSIFGIFEIFNILSYFRS